ncbi:MAG: DUF1569 domain-containing protein [Calditrichaeota bacterium]|nr:MAG: DUF1569 domain-containing protein [Calditrichota bacterium]
MKNIFDKKVTNEMVERIGKLQPNSKAVWGKMNIAQMLAHCNVSYELVYENKIPKPSGIKKLFLKFVIKPFVVGEKPFRKNGKTAPEFLMVDKKDFEFEKKRLVDFLYKTQELGEGHFHNKESHSFGVLTKTEWNNLFYKHLDHHLQQFGV